MPLEAFTGNFTQQMPVPEEGIDATSAVMRSGHLHRNNLTKNKFLWPWPGTHYVAWQGSRYCIATGSGGQAIQIAMRAAGV